MSQIVCAFPPKRSLDGAHIFVVSWNSEKQPQIFRLRCSLKI